MTLPANGGIQRVARNLDKGKKTVEYLEDTAPLDDLIELADLPRVDIDDSHDSPMRQTVQQPFSQQRQPTKRPLNENNSTILVGLRPGVGRRDLEGLLPSETPPGALIGSNLTSDINDIVLNTQTTEDIMPIRRRRVVKGKRKKRNPSLVSPADSTSMTQTNPSHERYELAKNSIKRILAEKTPWEDLNLNEFIKMAQDMADEMGYDGDPITKELGQSVYDSLLVHFYPDCY
jgi:hypothetical protein